CGGPAAGHKPDDDPAEPDPRRLRGPVAGRPLRAVHLLRGPADPEIAARRVHRSLPADLDEPSARPGLGVSQALIRPAPVATGFVPIVISRNGCAENPRDPGIATNRLAQCEACRDACA